ncbi:hypothetical protein CVT26_015170 [Gymnopilus dilepis]|uniref:Gti1/Pac2 family protein n=1 Tax=Gymnopilus dilepis TaxID=231916 RepID=A0A409X055_9AGAR|nr:hypothetical protein CVT26_015170 [Gymnopilus dilepis]
MNKKVFPRILAKNAVLKHAHIFFIRDSIHFQTEYVVKSQQSEPFYTTETTTEGSLITESAKWDDMENNKDIIPRRSRTLVDMVGTGLRLPVSTDQEAYLESSWHGWIETTGDALLILEAAKMGLIHRITRRLVASESEMITSGSIFIFYEEETGVKRWTDGFFWGPSRVLGNFLLYRETEKRGAGHRGVHTDSDKIASTAKDKPSEHTKERERKLMSSLSNSYKFKENGLMKKVHYFLVPLSISLELSFLPETFSVTIPGGANSQSTQHVISYYRIEDVQSGRLRTPSSFPDLGSLDISPEYLDKTHFRIPPKVEVGVDGIPRYRGEADESELLPILGPPLTYSTRPLLAVASLQGVSSGARRHEPLASPPKPKKRRNVRTLKPDGTQFATSSEPVSPAISTHSMIPQPVPPLPATPVSPPLVYAPYPPYPTPDYYTRFPPPPPGYPYGPSPLHAVPPYATPPSPPPPAPASETAVQVSPAAIPGSTHQSAEAQALEPAQSAATEPVAATVPPSFAAPMNLPPSQQPQHPSHHPNYPLHLSPADDGASVTDVLEEPSAGPSTP